MKGIISILILGSFLLNKPFSKEVEGVYITWTGDSIKVIMDIPIVKLDDRPNYEKLQRKFKYYDASYKERVIRPEQAKEFSFTYNGEKTRMVSVTDIFSLSTLPSADSSRIFLKIVIDGPLRLFNYFDTQYSGGMSTPTGTMAGTTSQTSSYILQKNNSDLVSFGLVSFKKNMKDYLSDCPEVVNKIENKEYGKSDMEIIVKEYNDKCGK